MSQQSVRTTSIREPRPWNSEAASSPNSSLLVHSETNPHPFDIQSHAQNLIHHAVEKAQFLIGCALWDSGDPDLEKRAQKMGLCCVSPMIFADSKRDPVCVAGYCRDRLCPTCMRRRAAKVKRRLTELVCKMNAPRFLTLTERDNSDPLGVRIDRLLAAFRKLRHTKIWKQHVCGGVLVLEITWNEAKQTWHPHLHLLIDGVYWAHASLWAEWKKALGHDGTARIESAHDRVASARYMAKYMAKDGEISHWKAATICEFATAMHRRRLIATFGSAHRWNLDLCDAEPEKPKLPTGCISYLQLKAQIEAGDGPARRAAPLLARLGIAFRQLFFEFSEPGDCYADELSPTQFAELGAWIEQVDEVQRGLITLEAGVMPMPDTETLRLFDG